MSNITVFNLWPQNSFEFLSNSYVYKIDYESGIIRKNGGNEYGLLFRRNVIRDHSCNLSLPCKSSAKRGGEGEPGSEGRSTNIFYAQHMFKKQ